MNVFEKISNGWKISLNSFTVLKENKQLIIFPILSAISMILIVGTIVITLLASAGWDADSIDEKGTLLNYVFLFLFYLINYFVVVFFNMALVHCTHLYFMGEKPTISDGLKFSISRIGKIFSWAVVAAVVGTVLKIVQENLGSIGKIITSLIGIVWNIAAFFVIPVIAYENLGPIDALRRSAKMMKEKWGESLGATFSFGLIQFIAVLVVGGILFILGSLIHVLAGVVLAVLGVLIVIAILSAAQTIFISAVYHNVTDEPIKHFNQAFADNLFISKK